MKKNQFPCLGVNGLMDLTNTPTFRKIPLDLNTNLINPVVSYRAGLKPGWLTIANLGMKMT